MKISNFIEMVKDYEVRPIDIDDLKERENLLKTHKYSIIFEAEFLEFENAEKLLKEELGYDKIDYIFYGKLDYNYGFFEIFFLDELSVLTVEAILPNIFTKYPSGNTLKTNGYNNLVYKTQ